ncbi:MAG: hypothetical protein U0Q16_05015 [Bryobacteraceae bacterium]
MRISAGAFRPLFFTILSLIAALPVLAQPRVSRENQFERVVAVVPYVGAGTKDDPRRPLFSPQDLSAAARANLLSVQCDESDDGKSAICEFVGRTRAALDPILKANRADVKAFVRGIHSKQAIEVEMKKVKKDFDADKFVNSGHKGQAELPAKPAPGGAR